jgi:hypothetical protein
MLLSVEIKVNYTNLQSYGSNFEEVITVTQSRNGVLRLQTLFHL